MAQVPNTQLEMSKSNISNLKKCFNLRTSVLISMVDDGGLCFSKKTNCSLHCEMPLRYLIARVPFEKSWYPLGHTLSVWSSVLIMEDGSLSCSKTCCSLRTWKVLAKQPRAIRWEVFSTNLFHRTTQWLLNLNCPDNVGIVSESQIYLSRYLRYWVQAKGKRQKAKRGHKDQRSSYFIVSCYLSTLRLQRDHPYTCWCLPRRMRQ